MCFRYFVILILFLVGCTGILNHQQPYESWVGKELKLQDSENVHWHLWWQKGLTRLRSHSEGYVLTVVKPDGHQSPSYYAKKENAQHIASANNAIVIIYNFYEFGMEDPSVRAKANIRLKDGREFPCEIIWFDFIPDHLQLES